MGTDRAAPLSGQPTSPDPWPPVEVISAPCRSVLHRTRVPGAHWCINPYRGCAHGCVYCYAQERGQPPPGPWGRRVLAKMNLPAVLGAELARPRSGQVILSTVTDPYQPIERKARLTRAALELLLNSTLRVGLLTRSPLVLRDLDLLCRFRDLLGTQRAQVGFSIPCVDPAFADLLEPRSPPVAARLEAMRTLSSAGVPTWAFLAPIVPGVNDDEVSLAAALRAAREHGAGGAQVDLLTFYRGPVHEIAERLWRRDRDALQRFRGVLRNREAWRRSTLDRVHRLRRSIFYGG